MDKLSEALDIDRDYVYAAAGFWPPSIPPSPAAADFVVSSQFQFSDYFVNIPALTWERSKILKSILRLNNIIVKDSNLNLIDSEPKKF